LALSVGTNGRDFTWSTESRTIPCYERLTDWQLHSRCSWSQFVICTVFVFSGSVFWCHSTTTQFRNCRRLNFEFNFVCFFYCIIYFLFSRFLDSNFGSLCFLRGFVIVVSVILIHLTLVFHSLFVRTALHFFLLRLRSQQKIVVVQLENAAFRKRIEKLESASLRTSTPTSSGSHTSTPASSTPACHGDSWYTGNIQGTFRRFR
jgi:hypothetical protein